MKLWAIVGIRESFYYYNVSSRKFWKSSHGADPKVTSILIEIFNKPTCRKICLSSLVAESVILTLAISHQMFLVWYDLSLYYVLLKVSLLYVCQSSDEWPHLRSWNRLVWKNKSQNCKLSSYTIEHLWKQSCALY